MLSANKIKITLYVGAMMAVLSVMVALAWNGPLQCAESGSFLRTYERLASVGLGTGAVAALISLQHGRHSLLMDICWSALRYMSAYFMIYIAVAYTEGEWFAPSLIAQESRIAELSGPEMLWNFMRYDSLLPYGLAGLITISGLLLAFRRLSLAGALLGITTLGAWTGLNLLFGVCSGANLLLLTSSIGLIGLRDLPRIMTVFTAQPVPEASYVGQSLIKDKHTYKSIGILKGILAIGCVVYFSNAFWKVQRYYKINEASPIIGVWDVVDMQYTTEDGTLSRDTVPVELAGFKRLYLDKSRYGAVKIADDSLSIFEYIVDSDYNQLEFWNFFDFRDLDFKGKYHMTDEDTLVYEGTNRREALKIVLKRNEKYHIEK